MEVMTARSEGRFVTRMPSVATTTRPTDTRARARQDSKEMAKIALD